MIARGSCGYATQKERGRSTLSARCGEREDDQAQAVPGDTHTLEVHDTRNEQTNCQLDEIRPDHRRSYDSLIEATHDLPYDNCAWCLGGSTR